MVVSKNGFLTLEEMTINAEHVLGYLLGKGWTRNAVCGLLGNMQSESNINPGIWQGLNSYDSTPYITVQGQGYGLVQWTPFNKYTVWARDNGYNYKDMNAQLERIIYEVANNLQWFGGMSDDMTFQQFTQSTDTPEYLAEVFISTYEHPADPSQPIRGTQARYWWDNLSGTGIITDGGSGGGYQLAVFPMDVLHVTQGENSEFSHLDNYWAMDFVGTTTHYPYYAPVDAECIGRSDSAAILVWKSQREIMCANGEVRQITWRCIHDDNLLYNVGDKINKGTIMGHSGNSGESSGDHFHLEVYDGDAYDVATRDETWLHIFDVFAINGVTVIDDGGYTWIVSDYVDGDGGSTPTPPKTDNRMMIVSMLLTDTLNGWKW